MKKVCILATMVLVTSFACFDPDENDPLPWQGSYNSELCIWEMSEIILAIDTSERMGLPSGYKQGSKDLSRDQLVIDALKRTLPHVKRMIDFGLITFPFVDHRDGDAAPPDACTVGEHIVEPGSPYGWIVSRLEHIDSGGKASIAGALMRAYDYFAANPESDHSRAVVLFTAGGDECGGDALAAVDALAAIGVPTIVISYENASDIELLAEMALRGGSRFKQNAHWGQLKYLTNKTNQFDLQAFLEAAEIEEICDGIDNDCDGLTDEGCDEDGDGWGDCMEDVDTDPLVYPGATDDETPGSYPPGGIIDWFQGPDSDGNPIDPVLSDPTDALVNDPGIDGSHFSLGYYGFVEVVFSCPVRNGPGNDLRVIDGRLGDEWDLETADVFAWDVNGPGWVLLGTADNQGADLDADTVNEFDLGTLEWAARFRVVNTTMVAPTSTVSDGFDVDGLYAMHDCANCDDIDNDNDGVTDGGFGIGQICTQGVGVCTSAGIRVCSEDGTTSVCDAPVIQVSPEVCNGLDDDCDGVVDGIDIPCENRCGTGHRTCTDGNWGECVIDVPNLELCDGLDNDCDGDIDEDFPLGEDCRIGTGPCSQIGYFVCAADQLEVVCEITGTEPGIAEICNGLDDDCDGVVDNGSHLCPDGQICFLGQCVYD